MLLFASVNEAIVIIFLLMFGIMISYISLAIFDISQRQQSMIKQRFYRFMGGSAFGTGIWLILLLGVLPGSRGVTWWFGVLSLLAACMISVMAFHCMNFVSNKQSHVIRWIRCSLIMSVNIMAIQFIVIYMTGQYANVQPLTGILMHTGSFAAVFILTSLSLWLRYRSLSVVYPESVIWKIAASFTFASSFVTTAVMAGYFLHESFVSAPHTDEVMANLIVAAWMLEFVCMLFVLVNRKKIWQDALQYMSAYQGSPDSIMTLDRHGNVISANKGALKLLQYQEEAMIGKPLLLFVHSDDWVNVQEGLECAIQNGEAELECVLVRAGGQKAEVEVSAVSIVHDQAVMAISMYFKDVTQQNAIFNKLSEHDHYYNSLFDNPMIAIFLMDEKGIVITANQTMQNMTGYSMDELCGMHVIDFLFPLTPEDRKVILKHHYDGAPLTVEMVMHNKFNIETSVVVAFNPVYFGERYRGSYCVVRDVTFRKYLESTLLQTLRKKQQWRFSKADPGKILRMLMAQHNINTSELAAKTGLSQATISNLRTGKISKPQLLTAQLIAEALQVEVSRIWLDIETAVDDLINK